MVEFWHVVRPPDKSRKKVYFIYFLPYFPFIYLAIIGGIKLDLRE